MPRTKKAYTPQATKAAELSSRDLCTQLNNYQKEHGGEPYFGIYRCAHCGHWYVTQSVNFYKTPSLLYEKNNGYLTICKSCAQNIFDEHCKEFDNDMQKAMRVTCHELDWPFDSETFETVASKTRIRGHIVESYAAIIDNAKYTIGLSYSDTMRKAFKEAEEAQAEEMAESDAIETEPETEACIMDEEESEQLKAAAQFFGKKYNAEQLLYLQNQYDEWVREYDCQTKAHRELFKNICFIQLKTQEGTATKDDTKTLQDLMDSLSVKPKQQLENALAEQNTFGTLIKKWEDTDPVPEAAPEWKDVDGIGHYIRTYFLGHLCNMFHFDNSYAAEYKEEMDKYTVKPPHYEDESISDNASVMFKTTVEKTGNAEETGGA